ncbi:MAG: diguanylate cyclase [Clostridia bacterium]|nr:diguanylate cyclase [Clostridia bacterium]
MSLLGNIINYKYKISNQIGEGAMSTVWLAEDISAKGQVAIKVLKKDVTSSRVEDIIRFRNEATTVSKLNVPNIVKVYEIGELDNIHYIVMEYVQGKSLFDFIEEEENISVSDSIDIILEICKALDIIHNANIIHRDLKPGNMIINCVEENRNKKFMVKLIDFGLAQVREFNVKDTGEIVGTLSYMSPEQSGAIKRSVDQRSDLYSLGVIFYQLLTGELPFHADRINSIIYQHVAKLPEKLIKFNSSIPQILEKIVLKLLEKEPERRYQSAAGLISDLQKVKTGQENFVPGMDDKIIKLDYRTNLIGREEEFEVLKGILDQALTGKGKLCLISGEAGRGKTRLVEELRNYAFEKRATFIDGKCFSGKSKIPYGPFKDALNVYVRNFSKYPESKRTKIKEKMRGFIDELGGVILKLNPVVEEVLGECPPLVELDIQKENQRFLTVVSQFFYNLGKIEKGIVIMLDDLQWSDEGSLDLLNELIKEISKYPVLIVGTYRDNELYEDHGVSRFLNNMDPGDPVLKEIKLTSFDQKAMNKFLSTLLFDNEANIKEISEFILLKSKGNPFFAIEILRQLINDKAITRNCGKWQADKEIFNKLEISPTIVDILIKKISLLGEKEKNVLSYAAIIGRKFNIELLFSLSELTMEDTVQGIDKAIQLQLLEEDLLERRKISFAHDRIKEAFYKNISDEKKKYLHLKIASTIESIYSDEIDKVIFDLAYHYTEGDNKEKILQYAYPAAIKAKQNYANEEAIIYFKQVIEILEQNGLKGNDKWIECMENVGEICLIFAKTDEAIQTLNGLLPYLKEKLKRANALKQISNAYYKKGDYEKCEKFGILGLELLGEKPPVKKLQSLYTIAKEKMMRSWYNTLTAGNIKDSDSLEVEETKQTIWLYFVLCAAYSLSGSEKFISTVLRMVNLSERKIGKSKELGLSMMIYALYLAEIPKFSEALRFHKRALDIRKVLNDEWGVAQSYCNMGYYYKCKGEYRKSIDCFKENIKILTKIGDLGEIGAGISALAGAYINLSDYNQAKIENENYRDLTKKLKSSFGTVIVHMHEILFYTETGDFDEAERSGTEAHKLAEESGDMYLTCVIGTLLGRLYCETGEISKSIAYLEASRELYQKNRFLKEYTSPLFPFLAEAYITQYNMDKVGMRKSEERFHLKRIKHACMDALINTQNWITFHGTSLRACAKYYALIGSVSKAEKTFHDSIKLCEQLERKYEHAMSLYEYGKFLAQTGNSEKAADHYQSAYSIFKSIGSKVYKKRLANHLGIKEENTSAVERFTKDLRYNQKLSSILELTQQISSILNLDILLEKVMSVAIEVTGAQNGYIMIKDEKSGDLTVKVQKNIDGSNIETEGFSKSILNEVLLKGETVLTTNAMEDEKFGSFQSVFLNELKSVLCTPLKYNNEIIGVCYLDNPLSSWVFTEEIMDALSVMMTQAATSIQNARLYEAAITDGLTGLITHKHFKSVLKKEIERADRYNHHVALIMFDIDHFKKINDTYGHPIGDKALISVAKIVKEKFRSVDYVARYGGEEFAIIIPEANLNGLSVAAEELRKAIENTEILCDKQRLKLTVSVGASMFPHHGHDPDALIKTADECLYSSKQNGRNQVTIPSFFPQASSD